MRPIVETPRLSLRLVTAHDAAFLLELMNEPPFHENIGDRGLRSVPDAELYIAEKYAASYARHGFGLYLVETKTDGAPIGICGLVKRDVLDFPDLGYAYLQRHWSKGYAAEAAGAMLAHARATLKIPYLYGVVSPKNSRSIRLLERLGLRYWKSIELPGQTLKSDLYGIDLQSR